MMKLSNQLYGFPIELTLLNKRIKYTNALVEHFLVETAQRLKGKHLLLKLYSTDACVVCL